MPSAKETAVTVVNHVFRVHGLPVDVVSDRGPQFVSKFWREFCRLLGATVSLSSGFHPQTNGQTERANQDVERVLRCLMSLNPTSWGQQLAWVEYAHNSLPVSSTGLSPFECSLGYQPPLFPSMEARSRGPPLLTPFVQRCHRAWTRAREAFLRVGHAPRLRLIANGRSLPSTSLIKKCGFLPRTFHSVPCVISWFPNLLARFLSLKLLVQRQSASNFLLRTG